MRKYKAMMNHWLHFFMLMTIVSFFILQSEAKKSKTKGCIGPDEKIYKKKSIIDVDECYLKKCRKRKNFFWKLKFKNKECCRYKNIVVPNLSRKEVDGKSVLCIFGNIKEIPFYETLVNLSLAGSNESVSDKTDHTETKLQLELHNFQIFEDKTAIFHFSENKMAVAKLRKDNDECIYRGSFNDEEESRVLVTGCEEDVRCIQIHSLLYGDILATTVNGSVQELPDENDKFNIGKDLRPERDYIKTSNFHNRFQNSSKSSSKFNQIILPNYFALPLRVYMSPSWTSKFGGISGGRKKAKQVLSHVREWFLHDSLRTKIYILTADEEIVYANIEFSTTRQDLEKFEYHVNAFSNNHAAAHVYLTASTKSSSLGWGGICRICDYGPKAARSISKWYISDIHTAQTVAHEIGHNLGYNHDFNTTVYRKRTCGGNDLMNYPLPGGLTDNKWSECTNEDFQNCFSVFSHVCLDKNPPKEGGEGPGPPSPVTGTRCLTSPGYPDNYPRNYRTMESLIVPNGYGIQIIFSDFDVEGYEFDYLKIYDGNGNSVSKKLSGNYLPKITKIRTSVATLYFRSDPSIERKGFRLCYMPVDFHCATVYKHCNFGGERLNIRDGEFRDLRSSGQWNNKISSLSVKPGCKLISFRHISLWFPLEYLVKTETDDCLVDDGINDQISFIYCRCD